MIHNNEEALDKIYKYVDAHKEDVSDRFYTIRKEYLRVLNAYDQYIKCEEYILKKQMEYIVASDNERDKIVEEANSAYGEAKDILKSL